jgi:hypothetical protein
VTAAAARSIKFESNSIRYGPNQLAALSRKKKKKIFLLFFKGCHLFSSLPVYFFEWGCSQLERKKTLGDVFSKFSEFRSLTIAFHRTARNSRNRSVFGLGSEAEMPVNGQQVSLFFLLFLAIIILTPPISLFEALS